MASSSEDSDGEIRRNEERNARRRQYRRRRNRNTDFVAQATDSSELNVSSNIDTDNSDPQESHIEVDDLSRGNDTDMAVEEDEILEEVNGDPALEEEEQDMPVEEEGEDIIGDARPVDLVNAADLDSAASDINSEVNSEVNSEGFDDAPGNLLSDENLGSEGSDESDHREDRLFENSPLSVEEYLLAVLAFSTRYKLSGTCLSDLLNLIKILSPPGNKCVKTQYKFKQYFASAETTAAHHFYCGRCEGPLPSADEACQHCEGPPKVIFFLGIPVIAQLQSMFLRPGFYESLQFRFNRTKKVEGNIEDVYDSELYQEQWHNGFLNDPDNLSFMFYTDGISVYKRSKFSVWPIFLILNELKYKKRTQRENIIFAGIWFGSTKPNPNVFLEPLQNELDQLKENGHIVERPDGPPVNVHAIMLLGTADLQAKCRFMCHRQWNVFFIFDV